MTNEEREHLLEFLLENQARSEVRLQKWEEIQEKAAARMGRLESAFVGVFTMITDTAKAQKELTADVQSLALAQRHTQEKLEQTNERLDIFINVLERYISEGRNPPPEK